VKYTAKGDYKLNGTILLTAFSYQSNYQRDGVQMRYTENKYKPDLRVLILKGVGSEWNQNSSFCTANKIS